MTMADYDAAKNSAAGYELGIAAHREICIRKRQIQPRPDDAREQRWAAEGMVPVRKLETVKDNG